MKNKKTGPHPRPASEIKNRRIVVHLSSEEYNKIVEIVHSETPRKIAAYIRSASLNKVVPSVPSCNIQVWTELAPVMSNLNQIARCLNAGETLRSIETLKSDLKTLRNRLLGDTR